MTTEYPPDVVKALGVVGDLADQGNPVDHHSGICTLCAEFAPTHDPDLRVRSTMDVALDHHETCVWRRAVELRG